MSLIYGLVHISRSCACICACVCALLLPGVKISPLLSRGGGSSQAAECRGFWNCYGYQMDTTYVTYVMLNALPVLLLSLNLKNVGGYKRTWSTQPSLPRVDKPLTSQAKTENMLITWDYLFIETIMALWSNNSSIGFGIKFIWIKLYVTSSSWLSYIIFCWCWLTEYIQVGGGSY